MEMTRSPDARLRRSAILGLNARWYGSEVHRRIVECLKDPEPKVQIIAVNVCRLIDGPPPTTELIEALSSPDERVREAACSVLQRKAHREDPRILPAMLHMMEDPSRSVRQRAETGAYSAASTPAQRQTAVEASRRLKERNEENKSSATSPGTK